MRKAVLGWTQHGGDHRPCAGDAREGSVAERLKGAGFPVSPRKEGRAWLSQVRVNLHSVLVALGCLGYLDIELE